MKLEKIRYSGSPLTESEVPVNLRTIFDFDSQGLGKWPGRRHQVMRIKRQCPKCKKDKWLRSSDVRVALKRGNMRGHCRFCQSNKGNHVNVGPTHWLWKGGRYLDKAGYMLTKCPEHPGYIQEHRLMMERSLGRNLLPDETVHHKNGVRTDNRIENLELWSKKHGKGCRYQDLSVLQLDELIKFFQGLLAEKKA